MQHERGSPLRRAPSSPVKTWATQHLAVLGRTLRRLWHAPFASLFNILVIGIALAFPLGLYVVVDNVRVLAGRLPAQPEISLFLALDATRSDVTGVESALRKSMPGAEIRFVAREQALAAMRERGEMGGLLEGLPGNPLPDAIVVRAPATSPDELERLRSKALSWAKVDLVQVDSAWARRLDAGLAVVRLGTAILAGMLAFALLAITFNTIRLQILTQREEIEVSRLIGATNSYIRRPFLYFGTVQCLLGGAAALGIVATGLALINRGLVDVGRLYEMELAFRLPGAADAVAVLGFSALLGWTGAWLSTTRHLRALESR